jgi:hypothetical protein
MIDFDRNATQKFPDFPDEDDGGSNKIFAQKTLEEVEEELNSVGFSFFIIFDQYSSTRNWKVKAREKEKVIKKVR